MITEVKQFIEDFLEAEAISFDAQSKIKDLLVVNAAFDKMHSFTVPELEGMLGQTRMSELRGDDFYESTESYTPTIPRYLLKISRYKHSKYDYLWIAYTSEFGPYQDFKLLSNAFFIIRQSGEFKVGSHLIYSNQRGMNEKFDFEWIAGLKDLTFENLNEPEEIERYQEPFDIDDNLKLFVANI